MWMILLTYREARELCSLYVKTILFTLIFIHPLMKSGVRASADGGSGKGEYCTSDTDCDRTKFLQCLDHSCKCRGAEGLIWDNEVNSCAAMESYPCDDNFNMSEIKCITNSSCEYGVCSCNEGFLRNGYGSCSLSHGSVCSENDKCASRFNLECAKTSPNSQPTCKCQGELVWDDMRRKCVSTASGSCDIDTETEKDDQWECVENAECTDQGHCKCMEGFVQTPDGLCKLPYLSENCSSTDGRNHCNNFEFLVCRDNRCQCEFYGQMEYDNYSKRCKLLVGESCDPLGNGKWKPQCVDNANCVPRQGRGPHRGICQCVHPYVESERTCSRDGYGQQCNASMDCNVKKFLQCIEEDAVGGGHCKCIPNEMFWDGDRCRVYPGKRCSENRHCADNSYCEGTWCTCNQDYVFFNSFCVKPHEAFKATSTTIRSRQYVPDSSSGYYDNNCGHYYEHDSLIGRMCECQQKQGTHVWIPEKNACLALVGTPCLSVDECIPDADCHFDAGICQCSLGALATMNKTCIKINRQSTHNYHQDHEHFRECIESNTLKSVSKAPAGLPVAEHNFLFALVAIILSQYCYLNLVINDKVIS